MEIAMNIKPLSVNDCWQGRRFKTPEYKVYEQQLLYTLPNKKLPEPPFLICYEFGFSSSGSDLDNAVKPLTDILQKKYKFNDNCVVEMNIRKTKVKKGAEYFKVRIENLMQEGVIR